MGNIESALTLSSSSAALNGKFVYLPPVLNSAVATVNTTKTIFRFNNDTSTSGYFGSFGSEGTYRVGVIDQTRPNQFVIFQSFEPGNNQKYLQCFGSDPSRTVLCYNNTANGQELKNFYGCRGQQALYIGTNVPSGCTQVRLTYTKKN